MTKWLTRLSLAAVFVLGIHGEIVVGIFVGLGIFAYALPAAVDTYVVAAFRAGRDIAWALSLLAVTIGGGHYLIGATGGDVKRAVEALGAHGSKQQGAMGASVGVVIVLVLWRVHVLSKGIKADEAAAVQAAEDAEKAVRDAEIAERERVAQVARDDAEHAARLRREEVELQARIEREREERRIELRRAESEAEQARIMAEREAAERARTEASAAAAAAKAAKAKPAAVKKPEPVETKLHAVPSRPAPTDREAAVKAWLANEITQEEAAERAGVSTKTIQRDRDKYESTAKAVNG